MQKNHPRGRMILPATRVTSAEGKAASFPAPQKRKHLLAAGLGGAISELNSDGLQPRSNGLLPSSATACFGALSSI